MPQDECMGNPMLSVSTDSDCVRGPRDWGLTNHFCKYQPSKIQHAVQWLHVNFHTVLTFCKSLLLMISSSPIMMRKKTPKQPNKTVLVQCQNKGLPWVGSVGVKNIAVKIAVQTAGKAPVNSGPAWRTHSCSSGSCCSSVTLTMGFWPLVTTFFFLLSFCLWPKRWETGLFHVLVRSWGSGGPEGGDSVKMPCLFGMTAAMTWILCHSSSVHWPFSGKKMLKEIQHFDPAVMSRIVTKSLQQTKPNKIFSGVINPKTHGVPRASCSFDSSVG